MTTDNPRIISITCGPFQATLYPGPGPGGPAATIDLYHAGTTYTHPRFLCTGEEVEVLATLAAAAHALAHEYLAKGRTYAEWCADYRVSPFAPDIAA